jgi:hypothetical protein
MAKSKPSRSKSQAAAERSAMRKLRDAGLYTKPVDLRRAPSKYQKSLIKRFANVIEGRAAPVKPDRPRSYKGLFDVKGRVVVVPRKPHQVVGVDRESGAIRIREPGKTSTFIKGRPPEERQRRMYALPFRVGNSDELRYFRTSSVSQMADFAEGYGYENYQDYLIVEDYDEDALGWSEAA